MLREDPWTAISFEEGKVLAAERRQQLEESAAAAAEVEERLRGPPTVEELLEDSERRIRGPPTLDQLKAKAIGTVEEQQRLLRTDVYSRARENSRVRLERLDNILAQHRNAVASGPYGDNRGIADLVHMRKALEAWDGPEEISGVRSIALGPPQYESRASQGKGEAQVCWGFRAKKRRVEAKEEARPWKAEVATPEDPVVRAAVAEELLRAQAVVEVPEPREARLARWRAVEEAHESGSIQDDVAAALLSLNVAAAAAKEARGEGRARRERPPPDSEGGWEEFKYSGPP